MSPKNDTTIDLAVTSSSDQMKVVNTGYELVWTRAPIGTSKPTSQPDNATLSSSSSTPRTALESALSSSSILHAALKSSSKITRR